ncbi:hypothetical protein NC77_09965 [Janthinobacterium lividum]|nr:hypothetical protein NC77_09965 [Janthinobacterium lividum]
MAIATPGRQQATKAQLDERPFAPQAAGVIGGPLRRGKILLLEWRTVRRPHQITDDLMAGQILTEQDSHIRAKSRQCLRHEL